MSKRSGLGLSVIAPFEAKVAPHGEVELVIDREHFAKIVRDGIGKARVSVDVLTADFKAVLVPDLTRTGRGPRGRDDAKSIIDVFRQLARKGVEIRLLHSGVPSSAALAELKRALPEKLTIRRCPRLHAKAVV